RWDVETKKALTPFRVGETKSSVRSVAFSPDGKRLLAGVMVALNRGVFWNALYLLDSATGKEVGLVKEPGGPIEQLANAFSHPTPVAFSSDGSLYAGAAWNDAILKNDPDLRYRTEARRITALLFLKDEQTLAVAARDGTVRLVGAKKERR